MKQLTLSPDGKTSPDYYKQVKVYPEGKTVRVTDHSYTYLLILKLFFDKETTINLAGETVTLDNVRLVREY